ncbi:hypothetical protein ACFQMA_16685 [Halosimplex aquaticum]|uniref:Major facilitator superfamily (MFS) profile domain-containing protein n=1 Tax=Halosimplex aquaticum TaxID=3026162 RepID=A0ABD5Y1Z3_9EURY|nr:hypothetical protein [Halosimplex aquaticum]
MDGASLRWTAVAGIAFAVASAGALATLSVATGGAATRDGRALALVGLGTGAVGACCWFAVVERLRRPRTRLRGALAGALVGVFGPAGFVLVATLFVDVFGGTDGPLQRAGVALFVGLVSLLSVGWWSLPVGTATGYLLGRCRESPSDGEQSAA